MQRLKWTTIWSCEDHDHDGSDDHDHDDHDHDDHKHSKSEDSGIYYPAKKI